MVSVGCSPHHISGGAPQLGSGLATQCVGTSRLVVILPCSYIIYANRAHAAIYYRPPHARSAPEDRAVRPPSVRSGSSRSEIESAVASRPEVGPRPVCAQRPRTATVITPRRRRSRRPDERRRVARLAARMSVNGSRLPSLRLAVSAVSLAVHRPFTAYRRSTRHGTPRVRPVPDPVLVLACCVFGLARVSTCT